MGCVSSNLLHGDDDITRIGSSALSHHIVSLTSTTYGFLNLDDPLPQNPKPSPQITIADSKPDAIINSWELMAGLDNNTDSFRFPQIPKPKTQKNPKITDLDKENSNPNLNPNPQIERFEPICSPIPKPKTQKYPDENSNPNPNFNPRIEQFEPIFPPIPKPKTQKYPDENSYPILKSNPMIYQFEPICPPIPKPKTQKYPDENLNPNPNPNPNPRIEQFEPICPPTGENRVVIYTTSLRGVRRTFEACEAVRSAIESLGVSICERDVSMDLGFREELRSLLEGKGRDATLPPRVFVKGRYLGGAEEVLRIADEGHLGHLLTGCPRRGRVGVCECCGGVGFLTCFHCSGSCKIVIKNTSRELGKKRVVLRCCECNENGLVICPMCR